MNSFSEDDDYHYPSDLEEAASDRYSFEADDDDDEYQYSDDNDSASEAPASPAAAVAGSASALKTRSPHGGSGAAAKKKRVSSGADVHHATKPPAEYRVIDEEELFREQRALVLEIAQVLEVAPPAAAVLLRHFAWNKEKLYEGYYADPVQARADAGVAHGDGAAAAATLPEGAQVGSAGGGGVLVWELTTSCDEQVDCMICCDSYPANEVFGIGCGHFFCLVRLSSPHLLCLI